MRFLAIAAGISLLASPALAGDLNDQLPERYKTNTPMQQQHHNGLTSQTEASGMRTAQDMNQLSPAGMDFKLATEYMFKNENGLRYATGGVGDEEERALKEAASNYDLKVLTTLTDGAYVGDYALKITNQAGESQTINGDGPLIYVALNPGTYKLDLQYNGKAFNKTASVPKSGLREVHFRIPSAENTYR